MTTAIRSRIMRAIKSKDTKPEKAVRSLVHHLGYRFRLHRKDLPGKPDMTFPRHSAVVLVNGCFWHGHECERGSRMPKTNEDYWVEKIRGNVVRDQATRIRLKSLGWRVLVVWECEIRNETKLKKRLIRFLR
jgi:DNA mismatch endonuclease (patch repair protein)